MIAHNLGEHTGVEFTFRYFGPSWDLVLLGSSEGLVNDKPSHVCDEHQTCEPDVPPGGTRAPSPRFAVSNPEMPFHCWQSMRLNPRHEPDFLALPPEYRSSTHELLMGYGVLGLYIVGIRCPLTQAAWS